MADKSQCSAVFYSISEISQYLVEIHHLDKKFFISSQSQPICFASLDVAKQKARQEGATVGFLALDKTYEEVDFINDHDGKALDSHHELLPISLT